MKWFRIVGDYGPIGSMSIEYFIRARTLSIARELFAKRVERENPYYWEKMGYRNMQSREMK